MPPHRWAVTLSLLACTAAASAEDDESPPTKLWLLLGEGRRTLDLDWSNAGSLTGNDPNVANEYKWSDVQAYETSVSFGITAGISSFRWGVDYGMIYAGENSVSVYESDDREDKVFESLNGADQGYLLDMSTAYGLRFQTLSGALRFTPEIGYSWSRQNLRQVDGRLTVPDTGLYPGLDSVYQADWFGPWIGGSLSWRFWQRLVLHGRAEYHIGQFKAYGDINLQTTVRHPKSFTQSSHATGMSTALSLSYLQSGNLVWFVRMAADKWEADGGTDRLYFVDGSTADTYLNGVSATSRTFTVGFAFGF
jgi:hypothetical protein